MTGNKDTRYLIIISTVILYFWSCMPALSADLNLYSGSWINVNEHTKGIPELNVHITTSYITVQVWGSCTPRYCDWGRVEAHAYCTSPAKSASDDTQAVIANFNSGFSLSTVILRLLNHDRLQAEIYTRFTKPTDRRSPYTAVYTFKRK